MTEPNDEEQILPPIAPPEHGDFSVDEKQNNTPKYKFITTTYHGPKHIINNEKGYIDPTTHREFYWIYRYIIDTTTQVSTGGKPPRNLKFSLDLYNQMDFGGDSKSLSGIGVSQIPPPNNSNDIIYSINQINSMDDTNQKYSNYIKFYGESNQKNIVITECKGEYIQIIKFLIKIIKSIEQGNDIKINIYLRKEGIDGYNKNMSENPLKDSNNFDSMGYFRTVAFQDGDPFHLGMYKFIPIQNRGGRYTRKSRKTKSRKTKSRKTKSRKTKSRK